MTTTVSQQRSAFVLGAGFIGMSVVDELLKAKYQVTALVRRQSHVDQLKAMGVSPVIGTLEDADLIKKLSNVSDVVIHTATADHLPSAEAILRGVQQRAEKGLQAIYIHNSGAGVLSDGAAGRFNTDKVFRDDSRDDADGVPDTNPHRNVDNAVVARQKEIGSGARIAIMLPSLIYGYNKQHARLSIQIPTLTRLALKRGFAGHITAGSSVWSTVHVKDLARGYITLLRHTSPSPLCTLTMGAYGTISVVMYDWGKDLARV